MSANDAPRQISGLALTPVQQFLLYDAIDMGPALVFVADDDMNYLAVNNRACAVLGYSRAELLRMRVTDVAVSVEAPSLFAQMLNERSLQGDVMLRTKDGALLPFVYEAAEATIAGMTQWVSVGFVDLELYAKVGQLEHALRSRIVIEQAKGVLMGRYSIDATSAFEALRAAARSTSTRIHDVARRTIDATETPQEVVARLPGDSAAARTESDGRRKARHSARQRSS